MALLYRSTMNSDYTLSPESKGCIFGNARAALQYTSCSLSDPDPEGNWCYLVCLLVEDGAARSEPTPALVCDAVLLPTT
jgi:hypothetical protein